MVAITASNKVTGVAEGQTLTVSSQHGVLAADTDAFGYPLSFTAVSTGRARLAPTIQGGYGTLMMACGAAELTVEAKNLFVL
jgi:hypothetical protein